MLRWNRILIVVGLVLWPFAARADILSSPHFRVDTDAATTFGGFGSSTDYRLTDAGGEAVVGTGSSGSYKLTSGYVATLAQNIQLNVQPNGLNAYFPFETGTGTRAYDVSANNNLGKLLNAPTWVAGKVGTALQFNGTNQSIAVPDSTSVSPSGSFTVEAWIKGTVANTGGTDIGVVAKDLGSSTITNPSYELMVVDGKACFRSRTSGNLTRVACTASGVLADNTWYHLVGTYNGSNITFYLNGAFVTQTADTSVAITDGNLNIGQQKDTFNRYFTGIIDEVKIYNRSLSASEITAEYTAENSGTAFGISIPTVTPGASQTALIDAVVRTDAAGYDLGIQQDHNLLHTDATTTISPISGSIASPIAWSEGSTQGLGFTLNAVTGSGNSIESAWSSGAAFGAIPGSGTTFHSRTGFTGGNPERNTIQLRLDVPSSQKSGAYSNTLTYTATLKP